MPPGPLEVAAAAGALVQGARPIVAELRRITAQKRVKKQLKSALNPALTKVEKAMEDLAGSGERMMEVLMQAPIPTGRRIANDIYLCLADHWVNTSRMLGVVRFLSGEAISIAKNEAFMSDLKTSYQAGYDLLQLLARSNKDGVLYLEDYPRFLRLYMPTEMKKETRELEKIAKEEVQRATPVVEKVKAFRGNPPRPFNRSTESKLKKAFRRLVSEAEKLAGLDEATTSQMVEMAPDWMNPILELTEELEWAGKGESSRPHR